MVSFEIYRTTKCSNCEATLAMLHSNNVTVMNIENNVSMREYLRNLGFSSFPVVFVINDGKIVDSWGGFQMDKIQKYRQ